MKKKTRLLLAVLATTMVMAGCSRGDVPNAYRAADDIQINQQDPAISQDEALQIALADAGLSEDALTHSKVRLDYDDGVLEYEVDLRAGYHEYDYDIDANAGSIRSKDVEISD